MMAAEQSAPSLLDHALAYAGRGLEVFPCAADKAPLTEHGMNEASSDAATIRAWWRRHPDALIGCRVPENMVVVDIDPRHGGDATLAEFVEMYGPLPQTRSHRSGRGDGGNHQWYLRPNGKLGAKALHEFARQHGTGHAAGKNSWTSGIDLLHHGHRYTILPPSPHPETGRPYEWIDGGDVAPMPGWLANYVVTKAPPPSPPRLRVADEDSIADWFSANSDWNDILGPAGWHLVSGDGDRDGSSWRHPNATASQSCTIKHGCLFVYTPNTDFEPTEQGDPKGYTRFKAWATLEYDGDMSAAARAARERRDGPPAAPFDPASMISTPPAAAPDDPWPDPIPLGEAVDLPPFPIDALPTWIADQARTIAGELQVPVDLPALMGVAAIALVSARRATLHVRGTWTEQLNLYIVVAMPPGAGKSPAIKAMLGPLERWEQQEADRLAPIIEKAEMRKRMAEKKMKRAEDRNDAADAMQMLDEMAAVVVPVAPRLWTDDATPEALVIKMQEQGGRIGIVSTEGGVFGLMGGRYSDSSNLDPYLKAFSGDTITVDRVGRPSIVIRESSLTIGLTVQPDVLVAVGSNPENRGRGLTARFMYAMPNGMVGYRNMRDAPEADREVMKEYERRLLALAERLAGIEIRQEMNLSPAARALFDDWRQDLEVRRRDGGDLHYMSEWSTKLETSTARLAGLLHLADDRRMSDPVDDETLRRAMAVADYWIAHAKAVHDLWGADETLAKARVILDWIRREGRTEFSLRDVQQNRKSHFPRVADIVEPLELLTERLWIRPLFKGSLRVGVRGTSWPYQASPSCFRNKSEAHEAHETRDPFSLLSIYLETGTQTEVPSHEPHEPHLENTPGIAAPVDNPLSILDGIKP